MQLQVLVTCGAGCQQHLSEVTDMRRGLGDFERDRPKAQLIERIPSFGLRWADRSPEPSSPMQNPEKPRQQWPSPSNFS